MNTAPAAFDQTLTNAIAPWGLALTASQIDQLRTHYTMMIETNRVMNLTRITDPTEAATKHYADSLALVACAKERNLAVKTVLDIGTGAGFPAIPLAVARPDWSITAIDGTRKKIDFVRRVASAIGLSNLHCEHANSTHWETNETYDLVTMRAVANPVETATRFVGKAGAVAVFRNVADQDGAGSVAIGSSAADMESPFVYALASGDEKLRRTITITKR
jgi:16S rRNA (guanine527-N7)-methyltransferase